MHLSYDDESVDIQLRDSGEVARRAIILSALAYRGFLELDADEDGPDADDERFDLLDWLRAENLLDDLDPAESAALQAPVGTLQPDVTLRSTWSAEALTPLCWALSLLPALSVPDPSVDVTVLLDLTPASGSPTGEFVLRAALRDEGEIAQAREAAELWYWRATVQELLSTALQDERNELVIAILETAEEGAAKGILPPPARGDFPVAGEPYAVAPDHDGLAMVAEWRLRALNWLCGFGTSWGYVPLDI